MCFTESWLHTDIPDSVVSLIGFTLLRVDRWMAESGKKKGGGVAVYVNSWCNPGHITMKEQMCNRNGQALGSSFSSRLMHP